MGQAGSLKMLLGGGLRVAAENKPLMRRIALQLLSC